MSQGPRGAQDLVHALDMGAGRRWVRRWLVIMAVLAVATIYLFREARNFSNPEAMDLGQLGRNLAAGRGYTTRLVRPLSFHLLQERAKETGQPQAGILQKPHPDLHNPPVYPTMLAGVFKVVPERLWTSLTLDPFRQRPWPESFITLLNLGWLACGAWLVWRLGSRWFDWEVGLMASAVYGGTELLWRMSSNGLPAPFLMVLVLALADVLVRLDQTGGELAPGLLPPLARPLRLAALAGVVIGVGFLTRYAFGWLLIPAVAWMLVTHVRRWLVVPACVLAFALVAAPWMARNHHLSGRLLGTAGSAVLAGTESFPESWLERHLRNPPESPNLLTEVRVKLAVNAADLLRNAVPKLTGNWAFFLFVAGLLLPFRTDRLRRLRWFTVASIALMFVVEALTRTHWSTLVPEANESCQMVLMTPLVLLFAMSFFFSVLGSTEFGHPLLRGMFVGGAWVVFSLPLLTSLLPPRNFPMVLPVYRPDIVQEVSGYVRQDELMASDVPWAVAWYGDRECLWLPHAVRSQDGEDFLSVTDFERRVVALYLSPFTSEEPLRRVGTGEFVWGRFYLDAVVNRNLPKGFPLLDAYQGSAEKGHLFLADRRRW